MNTDEGDDELILSIADDVMKCLARCQFFEKLDNLLSPPDDSHPREMCDGTYKCSEAILVASGFDDAALADIMGVLNSKGACCDCEVLYNVAESSRLKAAYWRNQAAKQGSHLQHDPPTSS
jgi:hypothetical protein